METENNKIDANELDNVSGGQIIEGKDGKFYVTTDENLPTFDTKEDAQKAQILIEKAKERKGLFPFIKHPGKRPERPPFIPKMPFIPKPFVPKQPRENPLLNMMPKADGKKDNNK